jgi:hypothetical protein
MSLSALLIAWCGLQQSESAMSVAVRALNRWKDAQPIRTWIGSQPEAVSAAPEPEPRPVAVLASQALEIAECLQDRKCGD